MGMPSFNVYLGYDFREHMNLAVCEYSLRKHSGDNFQIKILHQDELRDQKLYWRDKDERAATAFSLTRFLIPYMERPNQKGYVHPDYSIFIDSDNLVTRPIQEVFDHILPDMAVSVVKHDYVPRQSIKMDGQVQASYPRKNWSSFIVFNNNHPSNLKLDLDCVNNAAPSYLHRFSWLEDREIGGLPLEYNYLVGEDMNWTSNIHKWPLNLHYTNGSPIFEGYKQGKEAQLWLHYQMEMLGADIPASPEYSL